MKFSNLFAAGAALAAGVDAQRPNGIPQMPAYISSLMNGRISSVIQGRPTGAPVNPNIPVGSTVTETATTLSGVKSIVPAIPTATSSAQVASNSAASTGSAVSGSNSTSSTNGTLVSCIQDAKSNPNQANSAQHRCNWAPGYDITTDWTQKWPNTGNTVKYTLTITNGTISPQGDKKIGFLVNGQNPGPKIEANWGDMIQVTIVNQLRNNGTSIHWHGMMQKQANPQDGVGGITQCPIAPGDSATYTFQATQYGTSWYHSHFSGQYGEGVLGPIVINGPTSMNYDVDLGTVMITDDYPLTAFQEAYLASRFGPPSADNYLLNGQNAKVDGSAGTRSKWSFTPGLKHKIRLINAAVDHHFKVQIDGHKLIVVAADLVPINPYTTSELSISTGQRYDVIVVADQPVGNYWFRALKAGDCSFGANDGTGIANGVISYSGANANSLPTSKMSSHTDTCVDEPASGLKPVVTKSVDSAPFAAASSNLAVGAGVVRTTNDTVFQWTIGGISQVADWSNPTLQSAVNSVSVTDATRHVVTLPNANVWTYWILQNQFFVPHPMHLHGHDFAILGQGTGQFNAASANLNFANPPRRDVVMLTAQGWTVIAFQTDNPGAWLMHCHIAWHAAGGLSLQFLERPSDIPALYGSAVKGSAYQNTCTNWKNYASGMYYKQSDSGLKRREISDALDMEVEVLETFPERRAIEVSKSVARRELSHFGSQVY